MIPALLILAFVLLLVVAVPVIVVTRLFARLTHQQRQIDALDARLDSLAAALAERRRERTQPGGAPEPVSASTQA